MTTHYLSPFIPRVEKWRNYWTYGNYKNEVPIYRVTGDENLDNVRKDTKSGVGDGNYKLTPDKFVYAGHTNLYLGDFNKSTREFHKFINSSRWEINFILTSILLKYKQKWNEFKYRNEKVYKTITKFRELKIKIRDSIKLLITKPKWAGHDLYEHEWKAFKEKQNRGVLYDA